MKHEKKEPLAHGLRVDARMPASGPRFELPKYMPAIDGLRAFAVLAVVLLHFRYGVAREALWDSLHLNKLAGSGFAGVDLFFVISGFLITGILLDSKGAPGYFRNFYIRRALRIWPLYYAIVVFVLFVYPRLDPRGGLWHPTAHWYWYAFYLQNFKYKALGSRLIAVTWSLAVEEQFYITWPFVVLLLSRRDLQRFLISLLVAAPIFRWIFYNYWGPTHIAFNLLTFCRMDGIVAGSLLALWLRSTELPIGRLRNIAGVLLLIGAAGAAPLLVTRGERSIFVYSFLALAFSGLLCLAAVESIIPRPFRALLNNSWLRYVGRISYGIYLLHSIVHQALIFLVAKFRLPLQRGSAPQDALYFLVELGLVVAIASASWWLFEQPILQIKRRFKYSRGVQKARLTLAGTPVTFDAPTASGAHSS